jgi:hypothetical protein
MSRVIDDVEVLSSRSPLTSFGCSRCEIRDTVMAMLQLFGELAHDSRHAVRLWLRRPLQIGFAILALAIGIGANTGVFSVVTALLLRSLPFHDPVWLRCACTTTARGRKTHTR